MNKNKIIQNFNSLTGTTENFVYELHSILLKQNDTLKKEVKNMLVKSLKKGYKNYHGRS